MATLNEVMKDTADAIREKTGKSDLIAPVDFAEEIKGITAGGSGGAALEGEYFLTKPNGRYWKSKLARMERDKYPSVMGKKSEFTDAQLEALVFCSEVFGFCAFSAIGDYGGIPDSGNAILYWGPLEVVARSKGDVDDIFDTNRTYLNLLGAWQEGSTTILDKYTDMLMPINGLVDLMRVFEEGAFDEMSDDEVLAIASEMMMIEQVTKEEYESWHKWE